ncbi:glycosyltransferase [Pacificimonas flava]|uniref:Glycosyl transferase, family 2 n=1 Tax=Pacificimonas flava TaxID=1234595 RepID=M2T6E4_9SPHN|nr:glycosyltransferase family 2 protein [Pacificimonas flava]EMD82084.1 glycosyl transferase, family 2 [Pacificimonas flava]MBB5280924.1 GT2 family glycosyltransferase [Pacificimonas flava]
MTQRTFDLVVCSYNRSDRIEPLCANLMSTPVPNGWRRRVFLVDNNSTDDTAEVGKAMARRYGPELAYMFEPRQGSSAARNRGIAASDGELVGFVDDDELLQEDWFHAAIAAFKADADLDFISGVYEPNYEAPPPRWLPTHNYPAVIGIVKPSTQVQTYGEWPGELMAGNFVIRRSVIEEVGPFDPDYGRYGTGTGTGEDRELHQRLLRAGKRGQFRPELVIRHAIPESRMRRSYYMRWAYSNGQSNARMDRGQVAGPAFLGLPRWRWRQGIMGLGTYLLGPLSGVEASRRFGGLLDFVSLGGQLSGLFGQSRRP